ncbi:MAG: chemotaxis protein CheB [Pseudomonadota bacterium]
MDGNRNTAVEADELFIVGIGASAGGLEAIRELAKSLPTNAPAAYIIVQHLSPKHKSLLATLVGRETDLEVLDLKDGVKPQANTLYVTPPNSNVTFEGDTFRLNDIDLDSGGPRPSIDRFFLSTAEAVGERAVGIILSGTGNDGAFGVQAIRGAGGVTIAQDDATAKYDGMPIAAIETGCVDIVMPPHQIGEHLGAILASPRDLEKFRREPMDNDPLTELLMIVLARTRVDFRDYKPSTIRRRIDRRMIALNVESEAEYLTICRSNPNEVDALFRDFLVSVTWFFRDPQEFEALLPILREVVDRNQTTQARIWIAGCATGEEAYTIAILYAEALGGLEFLSKDRLQIFATDVDLNATEIAKRGVYSLAALDNVPSAFIEKYFKISPDGAEVHPKLKEVVIVSHHNLCQDPPFINVDLVCCRNVLIYFGAALQARVLSRLNYALKEDGMIMLGTAETVSVSEDLFIQVGERGHVYRKRRATLPPHMFRSDNYGLSRAGVARIEREKEAVHRRDRELFHALARSVGGDAILVSDDYRILKVFGDIGRFISMDESSQLEMNLAILKRPLAQEARMLSTVALRSNERRKGAVHKLHDAKDDRVRMEALPLKTDAHEEQIVLIAFSSWQEQDHVERAPTDGSNSDVAYIDHLESELTMTRDALQQTLEELETSNEELQSSNEELQATNEELQAINEELETSNEELQSSNEELVTLNEEMQVSAAELTMTNDELSAILQNLTVPLLIVDSALQLTKASREAVALFEIRSLHSSPHLSQCARPEGFPNLVDVANEALRLGRVTNIQFETGDDVYALTCAPIANFNGQLQGATLTFMRVRAQHDEVLQDAPN